MNNISKIIETFKQNKDFIAKLGDGLNGIYHLKLPEACRYPAVCYFLLSEHPALHGDDHALLNQQVLRFQVITKLKAQSYNALSEMLIEEMLKLDWQEQAVTEMLDGPDSDLIVRTIDFVKEKEV